MTYPVDDKGNIRVDFVWGNVPMQPDEQRGNNYDDNEYTVEGGWATKELVGNEPLETGWATIVRRNGDQSPDGNVRYDIVDYGAHDIIDTGYSNYPAFLPNYGGDGDTGLEVIMPNLIGLTASAASAKLVAVGLSASPLTSVENATVANDGLVFDQEEAAGDAVNAGTSVGFITYEAPTVPNVVDFDSLAAATSFIEESGLVVGTVTTSTTGATSGNDGWIKSQSPASGTKVDAGSAVNLVTYDYVAPVVTTGPIAGFNRNVVPASIGGSVSGTQNVMFLVGRTVKPTVGDTISVSGTTASDLNVNWTVSAVGDDDSYNTGGTAVLLTLVTGTFTSLTATGGTWTKL